MKELDSGLSILLQLMYSLALDAQLVGDLLEGPPFQRFEEGNVIGLSAERGDRALAIAFATLALIRPRGLGPSAYATRRLARI